MFLAELFEESELNKVVVIYPGRFQPWTKGHAQVYQHLCEKYGAGNVYVVTGDKVEPPRSPFNFQEKRAMIALTGVDPKHIIQDAQPYQAKGLVANFDAQSTILIFAVSEKDMAEDPRFQFKPKKDGSPSYFQPLPALNKAQTLDKCGYITTVPTFNYEVLGQPANSATQIRAQFASADEATQKKIVTDLFGKFNPTVLRIMQQKLSTVTEGTFSNSEVKQMPGSGANSNKPITSFTPKSKEQKKADWERFKKEGEAKRKAKEGTVEVNETEDVSNDLNNPDPKIRALASAVVRMERELDKLNDNVAESKGRSLGLSPTKQITDYKLLETHEKERARLIQKFGESNNQYEREGIRKQFKQLRESTSWAGLGFKVSSTHLWPTMFNESTDDILDFSHWLANYRNGVTSPTKNEKCILAAIVHYTPTEIIVWYGDAEFIQETETFYILKPKPDYINTYLKTNGIVFADDDEFEQFKTMIGLKYGEKKIEYKNEEVQESRISNVPSYITEGGNVFAGKTASIKLADIEPTLNAYFAELKLLFPKKANIFNRQDFVPLGSVGKKDVSGDIDLGVDVKKLLDQKMSDSAIAMWNLDPKAVAIETEKLAGRARTASPEELRMKAFLKCLTLYINANAPNLYCDEKKVTAGNIFGLFPQIDQNGKSVGIGVQIDWMVGDLQWLTFSYYSSAYPKGSNVKGLHRTQLILAAFQSVNLSFNHVSGVKDKETGLVIAKDPTTALNVLSDRLGVEITTSEVDDYYKVQKILQQLPKDKYSLILDIYLKILDSTRCDIPDDIQHYWIANKDRLGLQGKFLPDESKLKQSLSESGVAGGNRIASRADFQQFLKSYQSIISKFPGFVSIQPSGSYNSNPNKTDFGDIDLITHIKSAKDKQTVKKELVSFFEKMPDDIIVPFGSAKYAGKKTYNSGEIVTVRYQDPILGYSSQIDNIIALDQIEAQFKGSFLDMPAEVQGLVLGLVKVATLEAPIPVIFKNLGIKGPTELEPNQEYAFNLSSIELQLRKVTYEPGTYKEVSREIVWTSTNFSDIKKILFQYDLSKGFDNLLAQCQHNLTNPRSGRRISGVFSSMISVKSGEVGTPKGDEKQRAIDKVNKVFPK
jgi:hypothetical protein